MKIALVRPVPNTLADCELTHLSRQPIDLPTARRQHAEYVAAIRATGCDVIELPALHDHPDSVFVEDTVVAVKECAVITRPGAASRRGETASMRAAIRPFRKQIFEIEEPGTLDGGDVLVVGRRVFVGVSTRTNEAAVTQLDEILEPDGYRVIPIRVESALHLKSVATALSDKLIIVDAQSIDPEEFDVDFLTVPDDERYAANVLAIGKTVIVPEGATRTARLLTHRGLKPVHVDNSELRKAEAGLTCCSVLL